MDPISQAVVGGVLSQSFTIRKLSKWATLLGMLGGMAADLDVLFGLSKDPFASMLYHRHFTHSLAFIPIGAAITLLPFLALKSVRKNWLWCYISTLLGYATHGLLDACTSYGTMLFWPFSDVRVAWDVVSIVDPIFTGLVFVGMIYAGIRKKPFPAIAAVIFMFIYMGFGFWQNNLALNAQQTLALSRGHQIEKGRAFPTLANLVVWRSVYLHNGTFYSDLIRVGLNGKASYRPGVIAKQFKNADFPITNTSIKNQFQIFAWFSDNYMVWQNQNPLQIGDFRYSFGVEDRTAMWGIEMSEQNGSKHLQRFRSNTLGLTSRFKKLWQDIQSAERMQPLPLTKTLANPDFKRAGEKSPKS